MFVPLYLEKYWTDFQTLFAFADVFGGDQKKTWPVLEFSEMCHLHTVAILYVRKSVFFFFFFFFLRLRLYFWTNSPHIWNIDESGDLQKLCRDRYFYFFIRWRKSVQLRQRFFSVVSPLLQKKPNSQWRRKVQRGRGGPGFIGALFVIKGHFFFTVEGHFCNPKKGILEALFVPITTFLDHF